MSSTFKNELGTLLRITSPVRGNEARAGGNDNSYKTATDYWRLQSGRI
jgi:hypothetical protein